jgi:hypothetical protein
MFRLSGEGKLNVEIKIIIIRDTFDYCSLPFLFNSLPIFHFLLSVSHPPLSSFLTARYWSSLKSIKF